MTASPELGVEDVNDETGSKAAATVPATEPQEPDQQGTTGTSGGVHPNDSGIPHSNITTDDQA